MTLIRMYLDTSVVNYSNGAQHPQYGKIRHPKLDKGDFVFVKRRTDGLTFYKSKAERLEQENEILRLEKQQEKPIDPSDPSQMLLANVVSSIAQFERDRLAERRAYGIAKAKAHQVPVEVIDHTNFDNRERFVPRLYWLQKWYKQSRQCRSPNRKSLLER